MPVPSQSRTRTEFTETDADYITQYLAKYTPDGRDRSGNQIWKALGENAKQKWAWSSRHTWQAWRNHYVKNREYYDHKVSRLLKKQRKLEEDPSYIPAPSNPKPTPSGSTRTAFTADDDKHLVAYLAKHSITANGRRGNSLYLKLMEDEEGKWPWSQRHTSHSWRERYKTQRAEFDSYIEEWQRAHPTEEILETPGPRSRKKRVRNDTANGRASPSSRVPVVVEEEEEEMKEDAVASGKHREEQMIHGKGKRKANHTAKDDPPSTRRKRRRKGDSADSILAAEADFPPIREAEESKPIIGPSGDTRHSSEEEAAGVEAQLTSEIGEEQAADNHDQELPPSDDYLGEIFDPPREKVAVEEEEEEEDVEDGNTCDDGQEAGDVAQEEEEEDELISSTDGVDHDQDQRTGFQVADPATPHEEDTRSVSSRDDTPTPVSRAKPDIAQEGKLYPDISCFAPLPDNSGSFPGVFPVTSTPRGQPGDHSGSLQIVSSLKAIQSVQQESAHGPTKIIQGPTPPTSVARSPSSIITDIAVSNQRTAVYRAGSAQSQVSVPADQGQPNSRSPTDVRLDTPDMPSHKVADYHTNVEAGPSREFLKSSAKPKSSHRPLTLKSADDITFASEPSTPVAASRESTPQPRKRPREPPRLEEGAFNNAFTDARGRRRVSRDGFGPRVSGVEDTGDDEGDNESDEGTTDVGDWPPARRKGKDKEETAQRATSRHATAETRRGPSNSQPFAGAKSADTYASTSRTSQVNRQITQKVHHPFSQLTQDPGTQAMTQSQGQSQHHPFSQPTQQVDSVPKPSDFMTSRVDRSSTAQPSKVALPSVNHPPTRPFASGFGEFMRRQDTVSQAAHAQSKVAPDRAVASTAHIRPSTSAQKVSHEAYEEEAGGSRSVHFQSSLSDVKGKRREMPPPTPYPNPRRNTLNGQRTDIAPQIYPQEKAPRVRMSEPVLPTAHAIAGSLDDSLLGTSLRHRRSSLMNRPRSRATSLDPDLHLSEADESVIVQIGIDSAIQTMSENHGFNPEIVRRVWSQTGSLKETDVTLAKMREAAERAALQHLEALQDGDEQAAPRPARGRSSDARRSRSSVGGAPSRSSHVGTSSVLQIEPIIDHAQEGSDDEYSPPRRSRAGQYARLVKEGREDEALAREYSRLGGISPFQTPDKREAVDDGDEDEDEVEGSDDGNALDEPWGGDDRMDVDPHQLASEAAGDGSEQTGLLQLENKMGQNSLRLMLAKQLGSFLASGTTA